MFEHAGSDRRLQVFAAAAFEHDGFDPLQVQEVREQQPRRPTPDDPYLRTHLFLLPCFGEDTPGNGEGGVGCGRPAVDGALEEDLSYLLFRQAVADGAHVQLQLVEAAQRDER